MHQPSLELKFNPDIKPSFFDIMNVFLLAMVGLAAFVILVLAAFALSSCLGDEIRAAWSGRERYVPTTFGQQYARSMGHGGNQAGWEQIEMEDLMDQSYTHRD
jgi:hypothetical protein